MKAFGWCLSLLALLSLAGPGSVAFGDGNDTLGAIATAPGSGLVVAGIGLKDAQPGTISLTIPAGVTVAQAFLYWTIRDDNGIIVGDDTIIVETSSFGPMEITGDFIGVNNIVGGVTKPSSGYRADITGLGILSTGLNEVEVSGLTAVFKTPGAGIVAIIDDGIHTATQEIRDGVDFAFVGFSGTAQVLEPQNYSFPSSTVERTADLCLMFGDAEAIRPDIIDITIDGSTQSFCALLASSSGEEWDVLTFPLTIPIGATEVLVEAFSDRCGAPGEFTGRGDSLTWVMGALSVRDPLVAIDVRKQAEGPDTRTFTSGSDVTFEIVVTNTGEVDLMNVIATDVLSPDCDRDIGDLAAGDSVTYSCTATDVTDSFTNEVCVSGEGDGQRVDDCDPSTVEIIDIDIRKQAEGPDSRSVNSGDDVEFEIVVTNTGDEDLENVMVTDVLTPDCDRDIGDLAAGASVTYTCTAPNVTSSFENEACVEGSRNGVTVDDCDPSTVQVPGIDIRKQAEGSDTRTFASGSDVTFEIVVSNTGDVDLTGVVVTDVLSPDCDRDIGDLAVGASVTYSCTASNVTDSFVNEACVEGMTPDGTMVDDCDPSTVEIIDIDIRKQEEGSDSRSFPFGSDVTFEIVVTNTGPEDLENVVVTDVLAPDCDRDIGDLASGASVTYTCTSLNVTKGFTNEACVEGSRNGVTVDDCDPSTVVIEEPNPAIDIRKQAEGADTRAFASGSDVTFEIVVTNTGDVDLTDVVVTDVLSPDCDRDIGDLAQGDSVTYSCTTTNVTSSFTNEACVTSVSPDGSTPEDCDPSTVEIIDIDIRKQAEGADTRTFASGSDVTFEIVVTNTGDEDLENVTVTDVLAPDCDRDIGDLAAGASVTYTCTAAGVTSSFDNEACVEGERNGTTVDDCDPSTVEIIDIDIRKNAEGADSQTVPSGTDVTFEIVVTNTGDADLTNVVVTDVLTPDCDNDIGDLAAGASFTYTCVAPDVTQSFTNEACVEGQRNGVTVGDCDPSTVEVPPDEPKDCCEFGKLRALTFRYTGDSCSASSHDQDPGKVTCNGDPAFAPTVMVIANDKDNPNDGKIWFSGLVNLDETFEVLAENGGAERFTSDMRIHILTENRRTVLQFVKFHVSCSEPINTGDQFGANLVTGCVGELEGSCCLNGKPRSITMLYTGADCSATSHSQDRGKVSCDGDPMSADDVFIIANDNDDPSSGKIGFAGVVGLNTTFVLDAANSGDSKLASETHIHIFDMKGGTLLQSLEFHTSCSQPLFEGDVFGATTIISCVGENEPLEGDCCENGKPAVLSMQYTGDGCDATTHMQDSSKVDCEGDPMDAATVFIIANDKDAPNEGKIWFSGSVALDEIFDIDAGNAGDNDLSSETFIHIFASEGGRLLQVSRFHTSCSQPLAEGNQFGAALLVGCSTEPRGGNGGDDVCADGKPQVLTMRYTGEDCGATSHSQDRSKVVCEGDPADAPTVFIVANDKANPADGKIWFTGTVGLDSTFDIDSTNANDADLSSNTFLHIFDVEGGTLLQKVKFHTSCSQPLAIGDTFGSLVLEAFVPKP